MENQSKKCSSNKHLNIDAISYCYNCKKYLCNKCQIFHSDLFENHKLINSNQELNDIFEDICKQENHNIKFEFFCKNHNILCCSSCICKIKNEKYGQHTDCDVCLIKEIKDEKKDKLEQNIKLLEDLYNNFDKTKNELKELIEKVNKDKEEIKIKIQKIFTKIRSALNEQEEKLLKEVDQNYDNNFIKDSAIQNCEKLPNKIKKSLEKGKNIEKNWNENNLNSLINDCINIENNIKEINKINEDINKSNTNIKTKIKFDLEEDMIKDFLKEIESLGKITIEVEKDLINENFKIELKNPIYTLNCHKGNVLCFTLLNDGRLVSGARDKLIIMYNKLNYTPDLIIKEHRGGVYCINQLSSGKVVSCSEDNTIKLFTIKGNEYKIIQSLENHSNEVFKIIELNNKSLVSCSADSSILFYSKDGSKYKKDYEISNDGSCSSVIQTQNNEICYSVRRFDKICFFDFLERKQKASISQISKRNGTDEWFNMLNENFLAIPGKNKITIINVKIYKITRIIEINGSDWILGNCRINENMLFTGDRNLTIRQWKIEGDNLILISKKEKAHDTDINVLLNLRNGYIASGSYDKTIKIW